MTDTNQTKEDQIFNRAVPVLKREIICSLSDDFAAKKITPDVTINPFKFIQHVKENQSRNYQAYNQALEKMVYIASILTFKDTDEYFAEH